MITICVIIINNHIIIVIIIIISSSSSSSIISFMIMLSMLEACMPPAQNSIVIPNLLKRTRMASAMAPIGSFTSSAQFSVFLRHGANRVFLRHGLGDGADRAFHEPGLWVSVRAVLARILRLRDSAMLLIVLQRTTAVSTNLRKTVRPSAQKNIKQSRLAKFHRRRCS